MKKHKIIGIIPARYQSSRLPGKMLYPILGTSLLQRTFEASQKSTLLDELVIATDDIRIMEHATSFKAKCYMTSINCINGSERLADAISNNQELQDGTIYVNIQGDRPAISGSTIDACVEALLSNPEELISTPLVQLTDTQEYLNPSTVKCVIDKKGHALYFSRAALPYSKAEKHLPVSYKHVGIYAFQKDFLFEYNRLSNTPLMLQEDLEQLKVLEHGYRIKTVIVDEYDLSVDTLEDVQKAELWLQNTQQNISLSQAASSPL